MAGESDRPPACRTGDHLAEFPQRWRWQRRRRRVPRDRWRAEKTVGKDGEGGKLEFDGILEEPVLRLQMLRIQQNALGPEDWLELTHRALT